MSYDITSQDDLHILFDRTLEFANNDGKLSLNFTTDQDVVSLIYQTVTFMERLKTFKGDLFEWEPDHKGRLCLNQHPLGRGLLDLLKKRFDVIYDAFPVHRLNPWTTVFFMCAQQAKMTSRHRLLGYSRAVMTPTLVSALTGC